MKYALLIYSTPEVREHLRRTSSSRSSREYERSSMNPAFSTGMQLQGTESATTVRVQDGEALLSDGPFVDAKEYIGGFYLLEADDLDAATALAARVPGGPHGRRRRGASDRGAIGALLDEVFRDEWGRVLATLVGQFGDFDLAEEATQEAFAVAAERWPRDGMPPNPGAWLTITARNRAIDRIRREATLAEKTKLLEAQETEATMDEPEARGDVVSGRAARADLHVLPSGARARGAGGADAASAGRAHDRGDRPRLPRRARDDEAAAVAREAEDQGGRDPVQRAARPPPARAAGRGARRRLPDLQRGIRGPRSTWHRRRSVSAAPSPS